jgi:hypothetical protein
MKRGRYVVRPFQGGGVSLSGPDLPYLMRFCEAVDAMDYGHFVARAGGGSIIALDSTGHVIISETTHPRDLGLRLFNG